jgi:hypothetical protein
MRDNVDFRGGLVAAPKWVAWARFASTWRAIFSSDDYNLCRKASTTVLPMGQDPTERPGNRPVASQGDSEDLDEVPTYFPRRSAPAGR